MATERGLIPAAIVPGAMGAKAPVVALMVYIETLPELGEEPSFVT